MNETLDTMLLWQKNVQPGYDPESRKWRAANGQFMTKEDVMGQIRPNDTYGAVVPVYDMMAPLSRQLDHIQSVLGGLDYRSLSQLDQSADPIPPEILAAMRLSEYFCRTEGDIWRTVTVPIELGLRDLEVQCNDAAIKRELEEIYDNIDIYNILLWSWLCSEIYGQAFPLEVWDGDTPIGIVMLDPKYMKVGRQVSLTHRLSLVSPSDKGWDEEALKSQIHPKVYNAFASDWNEQAAVGNDIPIKPDRCYPITDLKLPFQRYAIPDISRTFRSLSTRQILEELQRATIEGFRNQLWVFKVGSEERPASPAKITHLRNVVSGMAGERTGMLVWQHDLVVEQHVPKSLDVLVGNDIWLQLSLHIYRQRGLSLRLVSGESPQGKGGSDFEWDVKVLIERLSFTRRKVIAWERQLRRKIIQARGRTWEKAHIKVDMVRPALEMENLVKAHLQPLGQAGWLSLQTLLQRAGYDYNVELGRKQDEEPFSYLFAPKPTFAQTTVKSAPQTVSQTPSPGRPVGKTDSQQREPKDSTVVTAGIGDKLSAEQERLFEQYVAEVYDAFNALVQSKDVDGFMSRLKSLNGTWMQQIGALGYKEAGGVFEVDPGWIDGAVEFINSFAEGFAEALRADIANDVDLEHWRWRVYLYPQEGRNYAYMWGVQQSMKEHGARSWRRILHPELSKTGPCDACVADSKIVHPISEGFWEPHPGGFCTAEAVAFYTGPTEVPVEVPIPPKATLPEQIMNILKRLGGNIIQIVRRIRG
ncbi:MAG: hypothetical protein OCU12_06095 [Methanophagales archaeon]|nr:hypothetical protein [Methanophagales archaeon]